MKKRLVSDWKSWRFLTNRNSPRVIPVRLVTEAADDAVTNEDIRRIVNCVAPKIATADMEILEGARRPEEAVIRVGHWRISKRCP
ncbi:uncharacterized protein J3R85_004618 [Psidium guajava]|nr:uncharacterized protein J3R85_004618 [Psidium guajava]